MIFACGCYSLWGRSGVSPATWGDVGGVASLKERNCKILIRIVVKVQEVVLSY